MIPTAEPPLDVPTELLAAALNPLAQCACVYDRDGRCLFANRALAQWLGRDEADLVGQGLDDLWPARFAAREAADLRVVLGSGRLEQLEARPSVGGPRQVRAVKYPWHSGDGPPVVVVVFDEAAPQDAQGRSEQLGWLALGIVHDFNNALTMLRAQAETLEEALADSRMRLTRMGHLLDHACQLPRQLLAFAREAVPSHQAIDVHVLLRSLEGLLHSRTTGRVSLEYRLDPAGVWIEGDPVQLTQALLNLAGNALNAMGGEGRLRFETRREGTTAHISVEDTGPGIPPEAMARIFEPLYTTRGGGSGLGLVVVREVVSRHGGRIGCVSEPGQGARFLLEFPLLPGLAADRPASPRVLVIDPERDVARLSAMILEQGGYRVKPCATLTEANAEEADVVVVCASALDTEGLRELETRLSRNPDSRLIVTSTGSEPALPRACAARLRGVISKPYSAESLLKAVR